MKIVPVRTMVYAPERANVFVEEDGQAFTVKQVRSIFFMIKQINNNRKNVLTQLHVPTVLHVGFTSLQIMMSVLVAHKTVGTMQFVSIDMELMNVNVKKDSLEDTVNKKVSNDDFASNVSWII